MMTNQLKLISESFMALPQILRKKSSKRPTWVRAEPTSPRSLSG